MKPDVLIVGAGPVGLFTAIQLKLYNPELSILLLEKYSSYQRTHGIGLKASSFVGTHPDPEFQNLIQSLPLSIRTSDLEIRLLKFAKKLGIEVQYSNVSDIATLENLYPDTKYIIGADGTNSLVRRQTFGDEKQDYKMMGYVAEIKYDVAGKTRYLNELTDNNSERSKYSKHYVYEFITDEADGTTPVTVRFFIDSKTFEKMRGANFRNPLHLNDSDKIEDNLNASIQGWMGIRQTLTGENRIPGSEKITVTSLPFYASKNFVKVEDHKKYYLVGDAAFGVPYFRGLHNGLRCSTQLVKAINADRRNELVEGKAPDAFYTDFMHNIINDEKKLAEVESRVINLRQSNLIEPLVNQLDSVRQILPNRQSYQFMRDKLTTLSKLLKSSEHAEDLEKNIQYVIRDLEVLLKDREKACPKHDNLKSILAALVGALTGLVVKRSFYSVTGASFAGSMLALFHSRHAHAKHKEEMQTIEDATNAAQEIENSFHPQRGG